MGFGATSLENWVRQARVDRGEKPGLTTEERSELVWLRRENSKLRMERELYTAEGLSKKDIIRCLKRFLAREVYQRVMTDHQARKTANPPTNPKS